MSKIQEQFDFGEPATIEDLIPILDRMYTELAQQVNQKPDVVIRSPASDGLTSDTLLSDGTININTGTLKVEMLVEHTTPSAVAWKTLS